MLLCFGATFDQGTGENFGSRNERSTDAKRGSREFFGSNTTGHVFAFATFAKAAVLGWNRQSERADVGKAGDDFFRHVGVFSVHVLGVLGHHFLAETAKRVLHHFVVVIKMAGARGCCQRGEQLGCAIGGDECVEVG